jgi:hypothetical protein
VLIEIGIAIEIEIENAAIGEDFDGDSVAHPDSDPEQTRSCCAARI